MFIEPASDMFPISFMPPASPGDGLAIGIGMSIFCCGDGCGPGEAVGICIPGTFISVLEDGAGDGVDIGMFMSICVEAEGRGGAEEDALGVCMPGMFAFICCGEGCAAVDSFGDDEDRDGNLIPGMLLMSCFLTARFLLVTFFFFRDVLGLDSAFGFPIPGIFDMSCCAMAGKLVTSSVAENTTAQIRLNLLMLFIDDPLEKFSELGRKNSSAGKQF